jgi:death-on-curing protein
MIETGFVIKIHEILINEYGGIHGVRDLASLQSALSRPFTTFDQKDLYASTPAKAASLIESLISNHPFLDGNKRIGYFMMRFFLLKNKYDIQATEKEKYAFVMGIASGKISFDEIEKWIAGKVVSI